MTRARGMHLGRVRARRSDGEEAETGDEDQQARRLEEAEARRAQTQLDEMALVRHLRKHALRQA